MEKKLGSRVNGFLPPVEFYNGLRKSVKHKIISLMVKSPFRFEVLFGFELIINIHPVLKSLLFLLGKTLKT